MPQSKIFNHLTLWMSRIQSLPSGLAPTFPFHQSRQDDPEQGEEAFAVLGIGGCFRAGRAQDIARVEVRSSAGQITLFQESVEAMCCSLR